MDMRAGVLVGILGCLVAVAAGPARAIGPGFDCAKADTPLAEAICASPDLSRLDLQFNQAYQALRHQLAPPGRSALVEQAVGFTGKVEAACGLAASGPAPVVSPTLLACIDGQYRGQRQAWLAHLSGPAREEATRPLRQHIALQRDLLALGDLAAGAKIDGVYGPATRAAIVSWQLSHNEQPTGFLDNADALALAAQASGAKPNQGPPIADIARLRCSDVTKASQLALVTIVVAEVRYLETNYPDLTTEWGSFTKNPTPAAVHEAGDLGAFVKTQCNEAGAANTSLASIMDKAANLMRSDALETWLNQHGMESASVMPATDQGWYILTNADRCMPAVDAALMLRSPAAMIQFDRLNGLSDDVDVFDEDNGVPVAVKVGKPEGNGMENVFTFFRGEARCAAYAGHRRKMLNGLN